MKILGHVTRGNVFEDLGFSREEAIDLAMEVDNARITVKIPGHIVPITDWEHMLHKGKMCLARMYLRGRGLLEELEG